MATRTTITIEDDLLEKIRMAANKNRRDLSAEICQLVDEAFADRAAREKRSRLRKQGISGRPTRPDPDAQR